MSRRDMLWLEFPRRDEKGRRIDRRPYFPGHVLLEAYGRLSEMNDPLESRPFLQGAAGSMLSCIEDFLDGTGRRCDEVLFRPHLYLVMDWRERLGRSGYEFGKPRLAIRTRVNQSGNLTVTFEFSYLDRSGQVRHAGEWQEVRFGGSFYGVRPFDELLYVKDAGSLFRGLLWRRDRELWQHYRVPAMQAINAMFWLTVARIERLFDVTVLECPVLIMDEEAGDAVCGIDICCLIDARRRELRESLAELEKEAGVPPAYFWAVCKDSSSGSRRRRLLLKASGAEAQLTETRIEHLYEDMTDAIDLGEWEPPAILPEVEPGDAARRERAAARRAEAAASPPKLRRVPVLDDAVKAEFGVETAHELVGIANRRRKERGTFSLPQGDFPSNSKNLRKLLKELRGPVSTG